MRAVLDCNVVVSGLIRPDGPPAQIMRAFLQGNFETALCPAILKEYGLVLRTPKVRRCIPVSIDEIDAFLTTLALAAFWIEDPTPAAPIILQDPSDDIYLLAAAQARADCVVSGDRHLLGLQRYEDIPILSPRDFLQTLG